MAEAIGFILAIAGLYSSCIDAFDQIRAARSFGRDYEILSTRFDVRKARFLQWGDGVGLLQELQEGRHPHLDSPSIRPALERVLHCIKMLLTDTEDFKSKYGLQEIADEERLKKGASTAATTGAVISGRRRDLFKASYARFQARIRKGQKETSLVRKTQWAIVGRDEFQSLVADLDGMIEDLYKLIPVQPAFRKLMVKEDIDTLPEDLATLNLVQEACAVDARTDDNDHWLEAASVRIELTELGTQGRHQINDWLAEVRSEAAAEDQVHDITEQESHERMPDEITSQFARDLDSIVAQPTQDYRLNLYPWTTLATHLEGFRQHTLATWDSSPPSFVSQTDFSFNSFLPNVISPTTSTQ
jgi:hypothetical protein